MGLIKGLKDIQKHIENTEARFSGSKDYVKTTWFKLDDRQAAKVVFLQEIDSDSPNFSAKNGQAVFAVEHVNPRNWRKRALCTSDSGKCFGCEEHSKDYRAQWGPKTRLYINVLVDDTVNEPYVAVMSQGMGAKSITPSLLEFATEDQTITDKWWKIKRNGEKRDTSYLLMPSGLHGVDVESFELFDLDKVVRHVPYEEQEAFYLEGNVAQEESTVGWTPAAADETW